MTVTVLLDDLFTADCHFMSGSEDYTESIKELIFLCEIFHPPRQATCAYLSAGTERLCEGAVAGCGSTAGEGTGADFHPRREGGGAH